MKNLCKNTILVFLFLSYLQAQDKTVELEGIRDNQISIAGFILNSQKTLKLEVVGAGNTEPLKTIHDFQNDKFNLFAYAWILNSDSRKMVWRMTIDNSEKDWWDKWNRKFSGNINLPKGRYELYFSAVEPSYFNIHDGFFSLGRLFDKMIGDDTWWEDHSKKWMCKISGVDKKLDENDIRKSIKNINSKSIVHITGVNNQAFIENEFRLKDSLRVNIYAIGEGYKGKMYDYGLLTNQESNHKIWEMREAETEYAGGAVKNRIDRRNTILPPGTYTVYYKSDGNHSLEKWNANPPYDPLYWGVNISVAEKNYNPESIIRIQSKKKKPFLQLDGLGDDCNVEKEFTVAKPFKIKIWAVGEGSDDEMDDYGWIINENTGETIWRMDYDNTEHAGGSSKNREYIGMIKVDKGKYSVHFHTDDSHSYEEWNAQPPASPKNWGISLYQQSEEETGLSVAVSDDSLKRHNKIIVQLNKIGDNEHRMKQLILKKPTRLYLICVGEGRNGEMFDYGWIENMETRETVWKMNYSESGYAGGAHKNRIISCSLNLPAGIYRIHYRSDDSHSYKSWNEDSPDNVNDWGITIYEIPDSKQGE